MTHGLYKTRLYQIHSNIKQYCYNEKTKQYKNIGAKGITVCDEWLNSVESFYNWAIFNGYSDEMTLTRKDAQKGFSPDNCIWIPKHKNTNQLFLLIKSKGLTVKKCAELSGIKPRTLEQYTNGRYSLRNAKSWFISALANTLEVTPKELIELETKIHLGGDV